MTTPAGTPIHPQFCIIDGLSIRLAESEGRDDDALLLSPWPASLFALEPIRALAGHDHLAAIGLPGFRQCERRDDLPSPPAIGGHALPRAPAALCFCDSGRPWAGTGFAAACAVGGGAAGASAGRDAR